MHTISYKETTKTKKIGGLSLRNLKEMNEACIAKLGWKIKSGEDTLWCEVMKGKYIRQSEVSAKVYDSSLWKQIISIWPMLDKTSNCDVGMVKQSKYSLISRLIKE